MLSTDDVIALHDRLHAPDFRVAHEAVAEPDRETMGVESTVTVVLGNRVHVRSVSGIDGVALHALLGRDTPAIVDAVSDGEDCKRRIWEDCRCALHEADLVLDLNHDERRSVSGDWARWSSLGLVVVRRRLSTFHTIQIVPASLLSVYLIW